MLIAGNRIWKPMFSPNCTRDRSSASSMRLIYFQMERESLEQEYTARGWWAEDTLAKWLARHVRERPEARAMLYQDQVWTWSGLAGEAARIAQALTARGVARGDVVAVQLPNIPEFAFSYLAIARLGAVMCPLHMPYRGAEVHALMRHSGARLAICMPQSKEMFEGRGVAFADIEDHRALAAHPEPESDDAFLLLYTSGTTAAPKGVVHPYRAML